MQHLVNNNLLQQKSEVLIIGQGLAGTLLSFHLFKNGIHHLVIDKGETQTASKIAAGLINPIGIKRLVKSWNVDLFLPYAKTVYWEMQQLLNTHFFFPILMDKIYGETDHEFWQNRLQAGQLDAYIEVNPKQSSLPEGIDAPYGFGRIKLGGRIDMKKLLMTYRAFLKQKNMLIEEEFNEEDLIITNDEINWKDVTSDKLIFCRGEKDSQSQLFNHLDFRNTKGELMNLKIEGLKLDHILMKGIFVLPIGNHQFKVGATFEHQWNDLLPSTSKKEELLNKWAKISELPVTVSKHITSIRPTMHDRRPVLGFIPHQPRIGIFNGLGSRGGMLAPYFANQLTLLIKNQQHQTFKEVMVKRYFKT